MSQLKDFSQISQEQALHELEGYAQAPGVLDFVKTHQSIQISLLKFISEVEDKFQDCKLELKLVEIDGERVIRLFLIAPVRTPKVIEEFNNFRNQLASKFKFSLEDLVVLNIKFPDSEDDATWDELDELIGAIEGSEDWAAEHDHYLYGTPKLYQ